MYFVPVNAFSIILQQQNNFTMKLTIWRNNTKELNGLKSTNKLFDG